MSRPLIGLLVATVAVFALWLVALKPSSSSNGGLGQYQSAINAAHNAARVASGAAAVQGGNLATPSGAPSQATTVQQAPAQATTGQQAPAQATTGQQAPAQATTGQQAPAQATTVQQAPGQAAAGAGAGVAAATAGTTAPGKTGKTGKTGQTGGPAAAQTSAQRLSIVQRALRQHRVLAMLFYNPAAADDQMVKRELGMVPAHNGRVVRLAVPIAEVSNYLDVSNQVNITQSPTLVLINPAAQASKIVGFADTFEIAQRVDDALAVR